MGEILAWALAQPSSSWWYALAEAYASGALRLMFNGRSIEYRSTADMERVMRTGYAAMNQAARRPNSTIAVVGGGYQ